MIIKRVVRTEDGKTEATLMLDAQQASFLMNLGLGVLIQRGAASLVDMSPEEFQLEQEAPQATTISESSESKAQKALLEACDIEIMPKA